MACLLRAVPTLAEEHSPDGGQGWLHSFVVELHEHTDTPFHCSFVANGNTRGETRKKNKRNMEMMSLLKQIQ